MNVLLLNLLESVLGSSKHTSDDNYAFKCINPKCSSHNLGNKKLEIVLTTTQGKNPYHCWSCGLKGNNLHYLFKKIKVDYSKIETLSKYVQLPTKQQESKPIPTLTLPKEFIFLGDIDKSLYGKISNTKLENAIQYLKSRSISKKDIYTYHIGYCLAGYYENRIIIPSYDKDNRLINFTARLLSDEENPQLKYLKPKNIDENIINFENLIDFSQPIYLCEGSFDAIAIGENAIPLFGKNMSPMLIERIYQQDVNDIYICLDKDAFKLSLEIAIDLMHIGKRVYLVEMEDKDPSKLGKKLVKQLIQQTLPMNLKELLRIKLKNMK